VEDGADGDGEAADKAVDDSTRTTTGEFVDEDKVWWE
jgi:hypothetical protein